MLKNLLFTFWRFSPILSYFAVKLDILPLQRSILECAKGHFRVEKGQMVDFGFQDLTTTEMPTKQGKPNKTTLGLIT